MLLHKFNIGEFQLQSGQILTNAWISYATWGTLNKAGDNCIIYPTYYTGNHFSNARIIGEQFALDPSKWFIVVPNLIGNAESISPSNSTDQYKTGTFPNVTVFDNVHCQKRLLDKLGVNSIALALGWSMGALQAWQWAVSYPDMVKTLLPICGATRCWDYNKLFIENMRAILTSDAQFSNGFYTSNPVAALKQFGKSYIPWAYSADFFRTQRYLELGFKDLDAFIQDWENDHMRWDANNLMCKLWTWEHADVSANNMHHGNLASALGSIKAKTIVMPCDRDQYFTLEENAIEADLVPNAELRPIYSSAGHCAGAPGRFKQESWQIDEAIRELLALYTPAPIAAADDPLQY